MSPRRSVQLIATIILGTFDEFHYLVVSFFGLRYWLLSCNLINHVIAPHPACDDALISVGRDDDPFLICFIERQFDGFFL